MPSCIDTDHQGSRSPLIIEDLFLICFVLELDVFSLSDRGASMRKSGRSGGGESSMQEEVNQQDEEDNAPLFYCPGKRGFYAPRQGRATYERLNAFRNVGR